MAMNFYILSLHKINVIGKETISEKKPSQFSQKDRGR